MAVSTTTTLAELIPEVIQNARMWMTSRSIFYPESSAGRQFMQLRDLRNRPGITGYFADYAAVVMGDATEGIDYVTTSAMDTHEVPITATPKRVVIPITDLAKDAVEQGGPALVDEAGRMIGLAAAAKFDADVFALFASLGTSINSTGTDLTLAEFTSYITVLTMNSAPGPYAMVIHPTGLRKLLLEASSPVLVASSSTDEVGGEIWRNFYPGKIMGVNVFTPPGLPTANAVADWDGGFISPWALGVTLKNDLWIEEERRGTAGLNYIIGHMDYGVGVLSATLGWRLLTDYLTA